MLLSTVGIDPSVGAPGDPAPANDDLANRAAFSGTIVTGTNINASAEAGETHVGFPAERSVWWSWTAPASGKFHMTTAGSNFDTLLAVYMGNSLGSLQEVAADDDSGAAAGYSIVSFNATAGTHYQVAVDGFQGAMGSITLDVSMSAPLVINGTSGNDTISVSSNDTHYVVTVNGTKTSHLIASVLSLQINGGAGNDTITLTPQIMAATLIGGTGHDELTGGGGADLIRGEDGNDLLSGGEGDDTIYGNTGNDTIYGEAGDDSVLAGLGDDSLAGSDGNDTLLAGDGTDVISGHDGNDYIEGRGKSDTIYGGDGNDTICGGAGSDLITSEAGDDRIYVGVSSVFSDTVDGGDGFDLTDADANDRFANTEGVLA